MHEHLKYRQKIVAWNFNAPSFEGFGGKVGLAQDIKKLANGELLMVFSAGYWHMSPATPLIVPEDMLEKFIKNGFNKEHVAPKGGRIMGMRSADNGQSWSKPFDILVFDSDVSPQGLNILKDGTVIVFVNNQASWYGFEKAPEGQMQVNTRTGAIYSKDNGYTWSEPCWFGCPYKFYQRGFCNTVTLDDGILLYATYAADIASNTTANPQLFGVVHQSNNNGKTWKPISTIERDDKKNIDEPAIAALPSGKLILITRPDGAIFYSEDKGSSWYYSHHAPWDAAVTSRKADNIKSPRLYTLKDGTLVCIMTVYGVLGISWSTDEGKTWATEPDGRAFLIDPDTYGYPGGYVMEDDSIFIVYYDSINKQQRTIVWSIRIKLDIENNSFKFLNISKNKPLPEKQFIQKKSVIRENDSAIDVDIM